MRAPLRVVANAGRPGGRVYVLDRRCHHGAVGCALAFCGAAQGGFAGGIVVCVGLALMCHDLADLPRTFWLLDD